MQCSKQRCFQHSENGAVLRQERLSPKMICRPTQCPNYSFFPMLSSCHLPSSSHLHRHFSTLVHCVSPSHQPTYFLFLFFFLLSHVPTILSSGISLSNPYLESVLCRKWTFGPGDFQQSSSPRRPILHVCRCLCFETTINGIGKTRSVCAKHFLIITQTSSLHSFHKLRN